MTTHENRKTSHTFVLRVDEKQLQATRSAASLLETLGVVTTELPEGGVTEALAAAALALAEEHPRPVVKVTSESGSMFAVKVPGKEPGRYSLVDKSMTERPLTSGHIRHRWERTKRDDTDRCVRCKMTRQTLEHGVLRFKGGTLPDGEPYDRPPFHGTTPSCAARS